MKYLQKVLLACNWISIVLTLAGYLASHVHPQVTSVPQAIGLFMPLLLCINLFFVGLWASLRKKYFAYSLCTLLLGFGQMQRLVGFHFSDRDIAESISLCSYNGQNYNHSDHVARLLKTQLLPSDLDILCLQEVSKQHIDHLTDATGFQYTHYHQGKFTLASHAILAKGEYQFDGTVNGFIWTDLQTEGGPLRIYNVHLRSNRIASEDLGEVSTIPFALSNYRSAVQIRVDQVAIILDHLRESPHPVIVAGDFNDSPFSYTYQLFANDLFDHFRQRGLGIGSTYAESLPGLKIDYIFASDKIELLQHRILRTKISDHFPLLSHFKLNVT